MATLTVQDLMTSKVTAAQEADDLGYIYDSMFELGIRHMPVVDSSNCLVGLISHRDLLQTTLSLGDGANVVQVRDGLRSTKASDVMVRDVLTVTPDTSIIAAGKLLLNNKLGCLPVTVDGVLYGILTESDFIAYVVREEAALSLVHGEEAAVYPRDL